MKRAAKIVVTGVSAAVLAAGGVTAYSLVQGDDGPARYDAKSPSSSPPTSEEAKKSAQAFLRDWAAGPARYGKAADATDAPSAARPALVKYHDGLSLTSVAFTGVSVSAAAAGAANAAHVGFTVTDQLRGGTWSYHGGLDVLKSSNGATAVHWADSVLHTSLKAGESLSAGPLPVDPSLVRVLGSDGKTELTRERFPSLRDIIPTVAKSGPADGGENGTGVSVVNAEGKPVSALQTFTPGVRRSITTTLDPELQTVAEKAVRSQEKSSAVALDYGTGHIRAVAFNGATGNTAFHGSAAPGSTMKMVTASAVIDKLGLTPSSPAPCIPSFTAGGAVFHNDNDETAPDATLEHAFAISCNTSFIGVGYKMKPGDLHDEAQNVFGIGANWSIGGGVFVQDGSVPDVPPDKATQAADLIGQGKVTMNPLAIASIAATIADSHFHQPVILPKQRQVPAARQISPDTAASVRTLMRAAASPGGTAGERMAGINGGAKTGTSEVGNNATSTNGWFAAFNKDDKIAVGALVVGGKTGADSAGFIAREILLGP